MPIYSTDLLEKLKETVDQTMATGHESTNNKYVGEMKPYQIAEVNMTACASADPDITHNMIRPYVALIMRTLSDLDMIVPGLCPNAELQKTLWMELYLTSKEKLNMFIDILP